jgi:hypothetical protein
MSFGGGTLPTFSSIFHTVEAVEPFGWRIA